MSDRPGSPRINTVPLRTLPEPTRSLHGLPPIKVSSRTVTDDPGNFKHYTQTQGICTNARHILGTHNIYSNTWYTHKCTAYPQTHNIYTYECATYSHAHVRIHTNAHTHKCAYTWTHNIDIHDTVWMHDMHTYIMHERTTYIHTHKFMTYAWTHDIRINAGHTYARKLDIGPHKIYIMYIRTNARYTHEHTTCPWTHDVCP